MRESFRLTKPSLIEFLKKKRLKLDIFMVYTGKEMPDLRQIQESLQQAAEKMEKLIHEEHPENT